MKKLALLCLTASLAGVVSAGSVTWSSDAITDRNGNALNGTIAYLLVGDDISGVADAIQGKTFDYTASLSEGTFDATEGLFVNKIGSYQSTDVSLYMIVFDTATVTDNSYFKIGAPISQHFGTSGNKTFDYSEALGSATWTPVTVPEPTTVALLALGLAAVGLKRKVA